MAKLVGVCRESQLGYTFEYAVHCFPPLGFAGSRSLDTLYQPCRFLLPQLGFAGSRSLDTLMALACK